MFTRCIFCHGALGANEALEVFPVGRRLAFDPARGRLWVVCRQCERWNLSPLDERWEAIEGAERLYRDTRRRASTDQIGLARLPDGTELVRVGRPQRPEFAAWRYGDQFGRRRVRYVARGVLGVGAIGALWAGGMAAGVAIGGFAWMFGNLAQRIVEGDPDRIIARLSHADVEGGEARVRRKHVKHLRLRADAGSPHGFALGVPYGKKRVLQLTGEEALRAAGLLLPAVNRSGGRADAVRDAVALLEADPDPLRQFARSTTFAPLEGKTTAKHRVGALPTPVRLALEMAAHEESERRALEGELAVLEQAWRDAEEIAAIADDMFLPAGVRTRLDALRRTIAG